MGNFVNNISAMLKNANKSLTTIEGKENTSIKEERIKNVKTETKSNNGKTVNINSYKANRIVAKNLSIFSILNRLNFSSKLYRNTKDSTEALLSVTYSHEDIKNLIEQTNSSSLDSFVKKINSAIAGKNNNPIFVSIANNILEMKEKIKTDPKYLNNKVSNSPEHLIQNVTNIYGDNRYTQLGVTSDHCGMLIGMFTHFPNTEDGKVEGTKKIVDVANHVKQKYGYEILLKDDAKIKLNKKKKTIETNKFTGEMNNCINMLYSVASFMPGSSKLKIKDARNLVTKEEIHDFLQQKGWFNTYFNAKYSMDNQKAKRVTKIFNENKEIITEVVNLLTTSFMARFVFDYKYYPQIEKDLSEQACAKMSNLAISDNPEDDFWINMLIQDRLKINISKVCASNNITNANQLLNIYNKNGTKVYNTENIHCINDLVFNSQFSENQLYDNGRLPNVSENGFDIQKPIVKKQVKIKKQSKSKVEKLNKNKFLEKIRQTEEYKKYYNMFVTYYRDLEIQNNPETREKLNEILNDCTNMQERLNSLNENHLTDDEIQRACEMGASIDAAERATQEHLNDLSNKEVAEQREIINNTKERLNLFSENPANPPSTPEQELFVPAMFSPEDKEEIINKVKQEHKLVMPIEEKSTLREVPVAEEVEVHRNFEFTPIEEDEDKNDIYKNENSDKPIENNYNFIYSSKLDVPEEEKYVSVEDLEKNYQEKNKNEEPQPIFRVVSEEGEIGPAEEVVEPIVGKLEEPFVREVVEEVPAVVEEVSVNENKEEVGTVKSFKANKPISKLTFDELDKKTERYFKKLIFGANGKIGALQQFTNLRILDETKSKKSGSVNDKLRLSKTQNDKANKIITEYINKTLMQQLSFVCYHYYYNNKNNFEDDLTVGKFCLDALKNAFNIDNSDKKIEKLTMLEAKKILALQVCINLNEKLKEENLELFVPKEIYKKYAIYFEQNNEAKEVYNNIFINENLTK